MDEKTQDKVEAAVLEILRGSDMESLTEYKVRTAAADRLGIDLDLPLHKRFVRRLVEDYLKSVAEEEDQKQKGGSRKEAKKKQQRQEEEEQEEDTEKEGEEEEEEEEEKGGEGKKEFDDNGDLIICRLSKSRRVTLQEFKGMTLVSIREYYLKDGKEMPTSKGISMTVEQWETFSKSVPAIEDTIKTLGESD